MIKINCIYWNNYGKCGNENVKRHLFFFKPICTEIYSGKDAACKHQLKWKRPTAPPPPPTKKGNEA